MSDTTDTKRSTNATTRTEAVHDFRDGNSLSHAIATAVADTEGTDPLDLPPLYEWIDVDALAMVLNGAHERHSDGTIEVKFTYAGYHVTARGDGRLVLAPETPD